MFDVFKCQFINKLATRATCDSDWIDPHQRDRQNHVNFISESVFVESRIHSKFLSDTSHIPYSIDCERTDMSSHERRAHHHNVFIMYNIYIENRLFQLFVAKFIII